MTVRLCTCGAKTYAVECHAKDCPYRIGAEEAALSGPLWEVNPTTGENRAMPEPPRCKDHGAAVPCNLCEEMKAMRKPDPDELTTEGIEGLKNQIEAQKNRESRRLMDLLQSLGSIKSRLKECVKEEVWGDFWHTPPPRPGELAGLCHISKTQIVIINGSGGAGKDTFIKFCAEAVAKRGGCVGNISSVDEVKRAAKILGWDGKKDDNGRQFLSDLKDLSSKHYDGPMCHMADELRILVSAKATIAFFHIREPQEIDRFTDDHGGKTLLIRRPESDAAWGNHADKNVENLDYDFVIDNRYDLEYLRARAVAFVYELLGGAS